jgi:hypothetical protein
MGLFFFLKGPQADFWNVLSVGGHPKVRDISIMLIKISFSRKLKTSVQLLENMLLIQKQTPHTDSSRQCEGK